MLYPTVLVIIPFVIYLNNREARRRKEMAAWRAEQAAARRD